MPENQHNKATEICNKLLFTLAMLLHNAVAKNILIMKRSWSRDLGSTPTFVVHVIASLDKALYADYLRLVASKKQQIK